MDKVEKYARKNNLVKHSVIGDEKFHNFFKEIKVSIVIEIGTYRGISTAYMAQFADKVYAFDIVDYPEKYKIWYDLNVSNKISFHVVNGRCEENENFEGIFPKNNQAIEIKTILDDINFDLAFIDGNHDYKNVKADFELVKKCGRVLFHDVDPQFTQVDKFIKELGNVKVTGNLGYWEKIK